jgi:phage minor structural protein
MILLNGHSLIPVKKVPLEALSLQLKERDSTATMTPADMDGITVNSWLKDEGNPGDGIVWRITNIRDAYATRTKTINLEHAIATLKDTLLFGEHGPAQITGNSKATSCTAEQAVRYILSKQSDWVLGSFGYSVSNPYKFDGDTLFEALETVSDSLGGAWWSYDFSVYPFRLNINQGSTRTESELRAGRNLRTIQKTIDKSGMYTRFYPIGADDLHIDGDYVELNTNLYGVISKVETDSSIDSKEELRRWATERLAIHAEPTVTIDVEGLELADATGETMDRLRLGYYCRVPLPEFNTTINERIITLNYPDKIHQPEMVRITLANNREDITKIVAKAIKKSGKSARTKAKKDKKDLAWFEDTNDHVSMCAKGIIGVDAKGNPNWVRLSTLNVGKDGIYGEVKSVQNDVVVANTKITQNENAITLEAKRAQTAEGSLSGRLSVTANAITAEVTRAKSAEGTLSGRIDVQANKIGLVVTEKDGQAVVNSASIVAGINGQTGSYVKIDADTINLSGYVTASQLAATDARVTNLMTGNTTATKIVCDDLRLPSSFYYHGHKYVESYISYKNASDTVESHYFLVRSS